MQRILLVGGAGFVGSHLARRLVAQGHRVAVYDLPRSGDESPHLRHRRRVLLDGVEHLHGDLMDPGSLCGAFDGFRPDVVVHLVAESLTGAAREHPAEAFRVTVQGTLLLLEAVRHLDRGPRVVYVSSSMVYGEMDRPPVSEDAPKEPRDIYGGTKLAAEVMVKSYARTYGFPFTIVRPSAVYGPTEIHPRALHNFVRAAIEGRPLTVIDAEGTRLDFTYVEDTAEGIARAATHPEAENGEFNISRGEARSLAEAITILRTHFPALDMRTKPASDAFRRRRGALDISRARTRLGYAPRYSLQEGLASYVEYMRTVGAEAAV